MVSLNQMVDAEYLACAWHTALKTVAPFLAASLAFSPPFIGTKCGIIQTNV